jgi:hypothetical protein
MMFVYTDGLSEAHNHDDKLFGRKQVLRIAEAHRDDTAQQLVQTMEAEVKRHTGDAPQSDDITLLAIKWQNHGLMLRATMDEIGCLQPYIERVAQEAGFDTQSHAAPGDYIWWFCVGSETANTEWKHFSAEVEVSAGKLNDNGGIDGEYGKACDGSEGGKPFQTVAFNLS